MNRKRSISRKQKRARYRDKQKATRASKHLTLGEQHDADRKAADAMRAFPIVPRLKQPPFPRDREFGFAGHYVNEVFVKQNEEDFVAMNVANKEDAWYWRHDPRGGRKPRRQDTGIVESNVSFSAGLARVLASLVEEGKIAPAQELVLIAGKAGMDVLRQRTGYAPSYMALHPDALGTLSLHYGLWPVDREERCLIGRSACGKKGKRGLRMLGHCLMSLLRHDEAIGLPDDIVWRARENLKERDPDDWAVATAMDQTLRKEIGKLPNGEDLLRRADEYQRLAAKDWLERHAAGAAGMAALKSAKDGAVKKEARLKKAAERLLRLKTRNLEAQKTKLQAQSTADQEQIRRLSDCLASQKQSAAQVMSERDKAQDTLRRMSQEKEVTSNSLRQANEKIAALEKEIDPLRKLKEVVGKLLAELLLASVKLGKKVHELLGQIAPLLGVEIAQERHGINKTDDSDMQM